LSSSQESSPKPPELRSVSSSKLPTPLSAPPNLMTPGNRLSMPVPISHSESPKEVKRAPPKEIEIDYKGKYEEEMALRIKVEEELASVKNQLLEYEQQYGPLYILPLIPLDQLPPPPDEF